ncbi:nucleoside/nucleotide kinase family protein [Labedaea rhizosphaerae]|uniref:nucleoside/nucleotide kinase family protein n=1 Tax=Labedaea rhizosphaerae TaxID=598644 RepID=UPI002441CE18|nr:nucleoside/nucleotide kinase family protein [Labedaea rhizosphaerae]
MHTVTKLLERVAGMGGGRRIVGICGPPGAGKSTLAARLAARTPAITVPMDGFHLANAELDRLGRRARKGAPDTFDAHGYVHLLRRLRAQDEPTVYAPEFDRDLDEPVAGAIPVPRDARLVITEGNYLLLDTAPWAAIRPLLDEVWYLDPDDGERVAWLIARHRSFGESPAQARVHALGSDQRNAELVAGTRARADLVLHKIP